MSTLLMLLNGEIKMEAKESVTYKLDTRSISMMEFGMVKTVLNRKLK